MSEKKKGHRLTKVAGTAALGLAGAMVGGCEWLFRYTFARDQWQLPEFLNQKMAGNEDVDEYQKFADAAEEEFIKKPCEHVELISKDGLKLKGRFYPGREGEKRVFLAVHGCRNRGTREFAFIHEYYDRIGVPYLVIDLRACGESEGKYMTFGVKESEDMFLWFDWLLKRCGEACEIYMHGVSMGAATVLITAGKELPHQVKGVIADCGYTSACDEFTWQMDHVFELPAKPVLKMVNQLCKKKADFDMRDAAPIDAAGKSGIPHLFIHGEEDAFVPYEMMDRLYEACQAPKTKVTVKNAVHARSYFVDKELYEASLDAFLA